MLNAMKKKTNGTPEQDRPETECNEGADIE